MSPSHLAALFLAQAEVGIVVDPGAPQTAVFASMLSAEIDAAVATHTSTQADEDALRGQFPDWPEPFLVAWRPSLNRLVVVRVGDKTLLLRTLVAAEPSPYAASIAAAELLKLARLPVLQLRAPKPLSPALYVSLGLGLAESFGHEARLLEPRFVVGAELLSPEHEVFSRLALAFRAPVESQKGQVRYQRYGPSVVMGFGRRLDWGRVGGRVELGMSLTRAIALSAAGVAEGSAARATAWGGLGAFAEFELGVGFSAILDLLLAWSASPADYFVRSELPLAEARVRLAATFGLAWRWQSP